MDLETRYERLKELICEHEWLIQSEILNHYPNSLPNKYANLIDSLSLDSPQDLIDIENLVINNKHIPQIQNFIRAINNLVTLPKVESVKNKITKEYSHQIGQKKQHEINQILHMIKDHSFSTIYDLCSGKAHLSHILSLSRKEKMIALDFDPKLQDSGKVLFKRYFKRSPNKDLTYITHDLTLPLEKLDKERESLLIGLHACGDLSSHIINQVHRESSILSIGCCYHKIFTTQNLSNSSKRNPLLLSFHALSLANKANRFMDIPSWTRRKKVKLYRYALHMIDHHHGLELENINQLHFSNYEKSFGEYASLLTRKELEFDLLFNTYAKSKLMNDYLLLESIRIALGRAVELFILIDRALYLKEKGHKMKLVEAFSPAISPRNIALFNF